MAEPMSPSAEAAAFHGMATNEAFPTDERFRLALTALDKYEAVVERLQAEAADLRETYEAEVERLNRQIDELALSLQNAKHGARINEAGLVAKLREARAERDRLAETVARVRRVAEEYADGRAKWNGIPLHEQLVAALHVPSGEQTDGEAT